MALKQRGIIADYLASSQTDKTVQTKAESGFYSLLFMTPEKACALSNRCPLLHITALYCFFSSWFIFLSIIRFEGYILIASTIWLPILKIYFIFYSVNSFNTYLDFNRCIVDHISFFVIFFSSLKHNLYFLDISYYLYKWMQYALFLPYSLEDLPELYELIFKIFEIYTLYSSSCL